MITSGISVASGAQTTSMVTDSLWSSPIIAKTTILPNSIEIIYLQNALYSTNFGVARRCYKIIYSCVKGEWNVSAPIDGEIIEATHEHYEFQEQKND